MCHTDDLVMMSDTIERLKSKFRKLKKASESNGLKLNLWKTKVMVNGRPTKDDQWRLYKGWSMEALQRMVNGGLTKDGQWKSYKGWSMEALQMMASPKAKITHVWSVV